MHELPRNFGQHIQLRTLAIEVDPVDTKPRRFDTARALLAQLDQLREREGGLCGIQPARAPGAEKVLQLALEHGGGLQARSINARRLRLELKGELLEIRVACNRRIDGLAQGERRQRGNDLQGGFVVDVRRRDGCSGSEGGGREQPCGHRQPQTGQGVRCKSRHGDSPTTPLAQGEAAKAAFRCGYRVRQG